MLDLRRVRFLCELADRGTLVAVAEAMNYSSSAVAQHIHALEGELGVRLIEPAGRNVRLTAPARVLVEHARNIFQQLERAESDVARSLDTPRGVIRVATFQTAGWTLVQSMIVALAADHHGVLVEFTEGENVETLAGLASTRFDLVVFEQYEGIPVELDVGFDVQPLMLDPLWLVVPPAVAATVDDDRNVLGQLGDAAWVLERPGSHRRLWAVGACQAAGIVPRIRFTATDTMLHLRLVRAGVAVALVPQLALDTYPDGVVRYPPSARRPQPARQLFTATRRSAAADPALVAARSALATAAREYSNL